MKKQTSFLLTGIAMSVLTACNSGTQRESSPAMPMGKADTVFQEDQATAQINQATAQGKRATADSTAIRSPAAPDFIKDPLLVREASLSASVGDIGSAGQKIRRWLEFEGGYYIEWERAREEDSLGITLTAKVPAGHFESFKDSVETLGNIEIESIRADDVTETYAGNQGRMAMNQKIGEQYRNILQSAARSKDALAAEEKVEEKLTGAEEFKESMTSLHRQAATGTMHIRLAMFNPLPLPQAPAFGHRLLDNLENGWEGLGVLVLFFADIWPWLILFVVGGILWRRYRKFNHS